MDTTPEFVYRQFSDKTVADNFKNGEVWFESIYCFRNKDINNPALDENDSINKYQNRIQIANNGYHFCTSTSEKRIEKFGPYRFKIDSKKFKDAINTQFKKNEEEHIKVYSENMTYEDLNIYNRPFASDSDEDQWVTVKDSNYKAEHEHRFSFVRQVKPDNDPFVGEFQDNFSDLLKKNEKINLGGYELKFKNKKGIIQKGIIQTVEEFENIKEFELSCEDDLTIKYHENNWVPCDIRLFNISYSEIISTTEVFPYDIKYRCLTHKFKIDDPTGIIVPEQ
jgi:hypothetical protein